MNGWGPQCTEDHSRLTYVQNVFLKTVFLLNPSLRQEFFPVSKTKVTFGSVLQTPPISSCHITERPAQAMQTGEEHCPAVRWLFQAIRALGSVCQTLKRAIKSQLRTNFSTKEHCWVRVDMCYKLRTWLSEEFLLNPMTLRLTGIQPVIPLGGGPGSLKSIIGSLGGQCCFAKRCRDGRVW